MRERKRKRDTNDKTRGDKTRLISQDSRKDKTDKTRITNHNNYDIII